MRWFILPTGSQQNKQYAKGKKNSSHWKGFSFMTFLSSGALHYRIAKEAFIKRSISHILCNWRGPCGKPKIGQRQGVFAKTDPGAVLVVREIKDILGRIRCMPDTICSFLYDRISSSAVESTITAQGEDGRLNDRRSRSNSCVIRIGHLFPDAYYRGIEGVLSTGVGQQDDETAADKYERPHGAGFSF